MISRPAAHRRPGTRAAGFAMSILGLAGFLVAPVDAADPLPLLPRPTAGTVSQPAPGRAQPQVAANVRTRVDVEPGGPAPATPSPAALNLFRSEAFRYQDPNLSACTSASTLVMLNTIALSGSGGSGFAWTPRTDNASVDSILAWARAHDTLSGGTGSDPHGWRNALNFHGWGSTALEMRSRVYEDLAFSTYDRAMKASIRQLIRTRKPVGLLAWGGRHAHMLTGYDGLQGDPYARAADGSYSNAFSVAAVRLTDPLKADGWVNARIGYATLGTTANTRLRFVRYAERDSPYDDPYTAGWSTSTTEWYGNWVIIAPLR